MKLFLFISFLAFATSEVQRVQPLVQENTGNNNARIIGGQPANISDFPFSVGIDVKTNGPSFFCGGTLITGRQWVITAAQCVDGAVLLTIHLGSAILNNSLATITTSRYVLHPDYNATTLENDIALINLGLGIYSEDYIDSIPQLGTEKLSAKPDLRAIGWGQTSDANTDISNQLNYVNVTSISNVECQITYGNQIKDTMVCVQGSSNEGICHGDTGSPLLDASDEHYAILVGISSFVSGNGCESTDPSGYTRTDPFISWISSVTGIDLSL